MLPHKLSVAHYTACSIYSPLEFHLNRVKVYALALVIGVQMSRKGIAYEGHPVLNQDENDLLA